MSNKINSEKVMEKDKKKWGGISRHYYFQRIRNYEVIKEI